MHFVLVMAVLAALMIAENSPAQPVSGATSRLVIATCGMLLVAVFAAVASGLIAKGLRSDFSRRYLLLRRFRRLRLVHAALWLGVAGGILYWLDWVQLVRFNWNLDHAFLVDEVLILTPILLPMVLSWAAFYEVDYAMRVGLCGEATLGVRLSTRRQYLALHVRHYLGILLLPVLGMLAVQDAAELAMPGILQSDLAVVVYLPPVVGLFLLFPVLLRNVWQTWPLGQGPLRDRLMAAAGRAGCRVREIVVWHTNGMVVNAAVAGFVPRMRYVFLTDALLEHLTEEEIESVFRHELAHVRHHHMMLRVMAMIAPLSIWLLGEQACPRAVGWLAEWVGGAGIGHQAQLSLLALVGVGLYVLLVFGYYSRLLEHQADLFGCRTLASHRDCQSAGTFISALEKMVAASGVDRNAPGWQHASVARRVDFLNRVARDPYRELRFQRWVGLLGRLLIAVTISPLVCQLLLG